MSTSLRLFVLAIAALYTLLGLAMFVFPKDMAPDFAWKVTPFMTMTIGGWCLGNAWLAWLVGKRWTFSVVYPSLIYLSAFGVFEVLVLLWFRDKIVLDHAIGWLYLVTLGANGALAPWLAAEFVTKRPRVDGDGPRIGPRRLFGVWAFLAFLGLLSAYALLAQQGDPGLNRGVFPELLSPFTLRAFGAFYLSIFVGAIPLALDRRVTVFLSHGSASYGIIVFITAAAFVYIDLFDFIDRPGGTIYFGAYLIVGVIYAINFARHGTGGEPEPREAPAVAA